MVFPGEAAVSVLREDGRSVRGALIERRRSVEGDPDGAGIRDVPPQPEAYVPLGKLGKLLSTGSALQTTAAT